MAPGTHGVYGNELIILYLRNAERTHVWLLALCAEHLTDGITKRVHMARAAVRSTEYCDCRDCPWFGLGLAAAGPQVQCSKLDRD